MANAKVAGRIPVSTGSAHAARVPEAELNEAELTVTSPRDETLADLIKKARQDDAQGLEAVRVLLKRAGDRNRAALDRLGQ